MPTVSRWMIRLSLVYLLMVFVIGAMMLIHKAYPIHPAIWTLLPVHIEMAIFGWIIQLTMGTAYWILPRYLQGANRGNPSLAYAMVILFNSGVLINILVPFLSGGGTMSLIGRFLELSAISLFVFLHWNRIVSYNK